METSFTINNNNKIKVETVTNISSYDVYRLLCESYVYNVKTGKDLGTSNVVTRDICKLICNATLPQKPRTGAV